MRKGVLVCLICLYCALCQLAARAQASLLYQKYTPSFTEGSVKRYIHDIEKRSGIHISYSTSYVDTRKKISLPATETTVMDALLRVLAGQQVALKESGSKILIIASDGSTTRNAKKDRVTINGYVKEQLNKEVLIGAMVYIPELGIGTTTNSYGYYSLTIPADRHRVLCSYIGYKPDTLNINESSDHRRDILLSPQNTLSEVKVTTDKETSPDHLHLVYNDIKSTPALLGENDIMRSLQYIAGVQGGVDGSSSIMVRGGDPGQNLNLLDGIPLYHIEHFFGLTSVFNAEAIKSVDFHKGAFPSRFGGRLSSVIDVNTKDGDMQRWGGQFTMGLVKSSLNVEGPVIKDKASIMLSARRTWLDVLWRPFTNDLIFNFYDVNGKANYILNKNNRLYFSFYNGRDGLGISSNDIGFKTRWGNTALSTRWNTIINPKLFLNTTVAYTQFKYLLEDRLQVFENNVITEGDAYKGSSSIKELSLRLHANWYATATQRIEFGANISVSSFVPTDMQLTSTGIMSGVRPDKFKSNEFVVFAEDEVKINDKWVIRPGLHFANWFSNRFNYSSIQPRFYTSYKLFPRHSIYASYSQMAQFLHLISSTSYGLPTDFWLPSSSRVEPEEASLVTLGYVGKPSKAISYNLEGYYKDIQNTTTYNVGKNLFDNTLQWDEKIVQGTGWSYGLEASVKARLGPFTFGSAYTWSRTWRKFAQLNGGKAFPYRFDRQHNFKATLLFQPSEKFDAAASWTYMSGEAITLPDQIYPDFDNNLLISPAPGVSSARYTYNFVAWNNYRLPAIHRLDIGLNFTKKKRKYYERTWSIGVFNAYGRRNVLFVELVNESADASDASIKLKGMSIFQYIPYISYKLKF